MHDWGAACYLKTTAEEDASLLILREVAARLESPSLQPADTLKLLQFLRARDGDAEKAAEMLAATASWRAKFALDDPLLGGWEPPDVIAAGFFPGGPTALLDGRWFGRSEPEPEYFDRDGSPVLYMRIGRIDAEGLLRSVAMHDIILVEALRLQRAFAQSAARARRDGRSRRFKIVVVQDLQGLGRHHLLPAGLRPLKLLARVCEDNFPETLKALYLINAPAIFSVVWRVVKLFFDPAVRAKFEVGAARLETRLLSGGCCESGGRFEPGAGFELDFS